MHAFLNRANIQQLKPNAWRGLTYKSVTHGLPVSSYTESLQGVQILTGTATRFHATPSRKYSTVPKHVGLKAKRMTPERTYIFSLIDL